MRLPQLQHLLAKFQPDYVLLQETKCPNTLFPQSFLEEMGYFSVFSGHKGLNGVAILSKNKLFTQTIEAFSKQESWPYRALKAQSSTLNLLCLYVPMGQSIVAPAYQEKIDFLENLYHFLSQQDLSQSWVIAGDLNIAPDDLSVCSHDSVLHNKDLVALFRKIKWLGLFDAYRCLHPQDPGYSWWDYRGLAYPKNEGMRIDHFLLSPDLADRLESCDVLHTFRENENPSDHAPILCQLRVP
jgi:exodeoxyribonuclease-3